MFAGDEFAEVLRRTRVGAAAANKEAGVFQRAGHLHLNFAAARQRLLLWDIPEEELAAKLAKLAPGDLNHIFFTTGGSVANDSAVRMAHYYFDNLSKPSKRLLISRKNAYHGSTFVAAALAGKMGDKPGLQFPDGLVHHISEANCYRPPVGIKSEAAHCDFLVREFEQKIGELGAGHAHDERVFRHDDLRSYGKTARLKACPTRPRRRRGDSRGRRGRALRTARG